MPLPKLIGISGYAGSGKDTVANYLVDAYGYEKRSFADSLKKSVAALFDIPIEQVDKLKLDSRCEVQLGLDLSKEGYEVYIQTFTFRQILQRYGTEAHRDIFGYDFWLDHCLPADASVLDANPSPLCISDVRFANEYDRIKTLGGINIRISRPGFERESHASEQPPEPGMIYTLIQNDKTIDDLEDSIDLMLLKWSREDDS